MKIDYSRFVKNTQDDLSKWQPPKPEVSMKYESAKLPVSTRVYPELLMAFYAYMQERHKMQASSISELLYWAICEALNLAKVEDIPPADLAASFLLENNFVSIDSKEIHSPLGRLFHRAEEMEVQALENGTLEQQAKFWKYRDPEKYESIIKVIEKDFSAKLDAMNLSS